MLREEWERQQAERKRLAAEAERAKAAKSPAASGRPRRKPGPASHRKGWLRSWVLRDAWHRLSSSCQAVAATIGCRLDPKLDYWEGSYITIGRWMGLSADQVGRGFAGLRDVGMVRTEVVSFGKSGGIRSQVKLWLLWPKDPLVIIDDRRDAALPGLNEVPQGCGPAGKPPPENHQGGIHAAL